MMLKVYHATKGVHVHCRVFMGPEDGQLALLGIIRPRVEEWDLLKKLLVNKTWLTVKLIKETEEKPTGSESIRVAEDNRIMEELETKAAEAGSERCGEERVLAENEAADDSERRVSMPPQEVDLGGSDPADAEIMDRLDADETEQS